MKATKDTATKELRQLIRFTVGKEEYGMDLLRVKEVIRVRQITWLPKAPSFVKGIINLRGEVIPIVDLREKFGLASAAETEQTRVIVVEVGGRPIGMTVDAASQVVRIPTDQIDPPPPVLGGFSQAYITGVGRLDDELVILLNAEAIFSADEQNALSAIENRN